MFERLKRTWFIWLLAAVVVALVAPRLIDAGATRPAPTPDAPATASRFVVKDPSGTAIGWLNIKYPRTIRENEEGVLEAEYTTGDVHWSTGATVMMSVDGPDQGHDDVYGGVRPPTGMKVELSGADLAITPAPTHEFDVQRIAATGVERVKWIVSPKDEGDHVLLVRFNVSPATFRAIPISANGQAQGSDPQILLPVKVFTIYGVPKATVLLAKGGVGLLSFLLTLPAAFVLFERVFKKKRAKPRRKKADGTAG